MRKTLVINAVALTGKLISAQATPRIDSFIRSGRLASVGAVCPAVTCPVQATYLTGAFPAEHGIIGNGWYDRADCEIKFWKQSDKLVERPRIWDIARQRNAGFTCANIGWWYAMYSSANFTVTPRPMYLADGRKIPDCWTNPPALRHELQSKLGQFPLFKYWGPATTIESSRWLAQAAIEVDRKHDPTLTLVYLPHLDYSLQRLEHAPASDLAELDQVVGMLLDHFIDQNAHIILLSEYGITEVRRPVPLNRALRADHLLAIRDERGLESLDAGASSAFALADHQIAHVYVNDRAKLDAVRSIVEQTPGVARVLGETGKREMRLDHERAGDLVCLAEADSWFSYYFWDDDARAPDYARTVDIHRKPGYDPVELFTNASKLTIATKLLKRKLGFRALLDVIPLDATLVKGSHGLPPSDPADGAMLATNAPDLLAGDEIEATDVMSAILRHLDLPD